MVSISILSKFIFKRSPSPGERGWGEVLLLLFLVSCDAPAPPEADPVLAAVHQRELRLSELDGMFPGSATAEDSARIIKSFADRWTRDAVLQWESERNLPATLNIDRLVRDYRSSLVRSSYEEVLVSERLDSSISEAELQAYYESNKEQYQLEKPIVRCYFIRVPHPTPQEPTLRALWNNGNVEDKTSLIEYTDTWSEVALLADDAWYSLDEVASLLPEGTLTVGNVNSKREFSQRDGSHRYYFRLLELKPRLEIAPLSYIEKQARKVILHNRKMAVLEDARDEIFERELRRNNIQLYKE